MMAACGVTDVSGKTYVFSDVTMSGEGVTDETINQYEAYMEGTTYTFNEDNTFTMTQGNSTASGTWSQDGSTVTITYEGANEGVDYTVSGSKLTYSATENGITGTMTFVQQ